MIIHQHIAQTVILPSWQQSTKTHTISISKDTPTPNNSQIIHLSKPVELIGKLNIHQLQQANLNHFTPIIGIDEAGRGPLLGSLMVSAVMLPPEYSVELTHNILQYSEFALLNDSKKLTEKKRELLFSTIQKYALAYITANIPASVIDQINILQATMLGMRLCAETLLCQFSKYIQNHQHTHIPNNVSAQLLIDGNRYPMLDMDLLTENNNTLKRVECQTWIKGDARHCSIAAASILAKVSRDKKMLEIAKMYPNYGIEKHKGYPTKTHLQAIYKLGILPEHRRSFKPIKQTINNI